MGRQPKPDRAGSLTISEAGFFEALGGTFPVVQPVATELFDSALIGQLHYTIDAIPVSTLPDGVSFALEISPTHNTGAQLISEKQEESEEKRPD